MTEVVNGGFPRGYESQRTGSLLLAVGGLFLAALALGLVAPASGAVDATTSMEHNQVGQQLFLSADDGDNSDAGDEEGEPPLANAGLDQETDVYAPVYLNALSSYAPEGEIVAYEWSIEDPNGEVLTPECPDCAMTMFVPEAVGRYYVTVTVTASNGLSSEDTLFVDVSHRDPPSVSLSGPSEGAIGEEIPLTLNAQPGTYPVMSVSWYVDDEISHSDFLDGDSPWTEPFAFDEPGVYTVTAQVVDESGFSGQDSHDILIDTDGPFFAVAITDTNSPLGDVEDLQVEAAIENLGDETDTQPITLETADGNLVAITPALTLDPDESQTVTMEWPACLDETVSAMVVRSQDDSDDETVDIESAGCDGGFFEIADVSAPNNPVAGSTVPVEATIRNTGSDTDTQ